VKAFDDLYRAAEGAAAATCGVSRSSTRSVCVAIAAKVEVLAFNRVIGLGVQEPASEDELDQAIGRFVRAGVPRFFVQLSPAAEPAGLKGWLEARGLRFYNNWMKLYRGVEAAPQVNTDLRIEQIGQGDADTFAAIASTCLGWPEKVWPWIALTVGRPGWRHYIAFDGKTPAATSALYVAGRYGWLDFAATLSEYRGRGAQGAFIARRIRDAAEAGCSHLVVETAEERADHPAPSYRNIVRFGFQVAYTRPNYILETSVGGV
jgi:hypothetical protein